MTSLSGKLREHELETNRLNVQESEDKHVRSIALKVFKHKASKNPVMKVMNRTLVCYLESLSNS